MAEKEYDDTNRGAFFRPHEETTHSLEGRVNVEGVEYEMFMIKVAVEGKDPHWELCTASGFFMAGEMKTMIYSKIGTIWKNNSDNERAPAVSGNFVLNVKNKRLSAWRQTSKAGVTYYQATVEDPYESRGSDNADAPAPSGGIDDDIPF